MDINIIILDRIKLSVHVISTIASVWFIRMQLRLSHSTIGIKMLTVLASSSLFLHLGFCAFYVGVMFESEDSTTEDLFSYILSSVVDGGIFFSLFWASTMSFVRYKAFHFYHSPLPHSLHTVKILFLLLIIRFSFDILILCSETILQLIPFILSIAGTIVFDLWAIYKINSFPLQIKSALKKAVKHLTIFPIMQVVLIGPYILYLFVRNFDKSIASWINPIFGVTIGLTGLINAWIYASLIKDIRKNGSLVEGRVENSSYLLDIEQRS